MFAVITVVGAGDALPTGTTTGVYGFGLAYVPMLSNRGSTLMQYPAPFERLAVRWFGP